MFLGATIIICLTVTVLLYLFVQLRTNSPLGKAELGIALADLARVDRTIELKGSLIGKSNDTTITELVFTVSGASGAEPIQLNPGALRIGYRDPHQRLTNLTWSKRWQSDHQLNRLDAHTLIQISLPLAGILHAPLGPNTPFIIDITPAQGQTLSIHGTTPAQFEPILELN